MPSLLPYLLLGAVAVVLLLLARPHLRRKNLVDEVKRFDHARDLTTAWSERARPEADPARTDATRRDDTTGSG